MLLCQIGFTSFHNPPHKPLLFYTAYRRKEEVGEADYPSPYVEFYSSQAVNSFYKTNQKHYFIPDTTAPECA